MRNELSASLTADEEIQVENQIERLFTLQDAPLGTKKKLILLDEIKKTRMPCYAILKGLESLVDAPLSRISFPEIRRAISDSMEKSDRVSRTPCGGTFELTGCIGCKEYDRCKI